MGRLIDIRISPSGKLEAGIVQITPGGDPNKFLNEQGDFVPVMGTGIQEIQTLNGILVTDPTGPVTTLDGDPLLPRDGSRPMTGDLDGNGNATTGWGGVQGNVGQFDNLTVINGIGVVAGGVTANDFNGVALTTGGPGTNFLADDGLYKPVGGGGSPSVGNNNLNRSDGGGGWLATTWSSFGGSDLSETGGGGTISSTNLNLLATGGVLGMNAGTDFNAFFGGGNCNFSLQSNGANEMFGLTGGASPGDVTDLRINGLLIPSVPSQAPANVYLRFPIADGNVLDPMLTDGAGQLFMSPLGSSQIINTSAVPGPFVTDALNALLASGVASVNATAGGLANVDTITVTNPTTTPVVDLPNLKQGPAGELAIGAGTPAIADVAPGCSVIGNQAGQNLAATHGPGALLWGTQAGSGLDAPGGADVIAIGTQAAATPSITGASGIFIGVQAGNTAGSGSSNIAIGNQAGAGANAIGAGTSNVLIGDGANVPTAGVSNSVNIGNKILIDPTFAAGFGDGHTAIDAPLITDAKYHFQNNAAGPTADTSPITRLTSTGGANGAQSRIFVGTRDPNGVVTGNPGDRYIRVDAANSNEYINTSAGPGTTWTALGGAAGGAPVDLDGFDLVEADDNPVLYAGADNGPGVAHVYGVTVQQALAALNSMSCHLFQVPGGNGGVTLAVYDATGAILAHTAKTTPGGGLGTGFNTLPFIVGNPLALPANTLVYFYFATNLNGIRANGFHNSINTGAAQPIRFQVTSPYSTDPVNGVVPNIGPFFGNQPGGSPADMQLWMAAGP